MSIVMLIYLADIVFHLSEFLLVLGLVFFISAISILCMACEDDISEQDGRRWFCFTGLGGVTLILMACLIPSKQAIYLIAGVEFGHEIAENQEVKTVTDKVLKVINSKLDDMVKTETKR